MTEERWKAVDAYFNGRLIEPDGALDAALQASADAHLPAINVSPNQGKLLQLLAASCGARSILEVGTLGGYSTIWLARALPPNGRLITLEIDPRHAEVARGNIERSGLASIVELRVGRAGDTLAKMAAERRDPFDFVFIDADKTSNADYFAWALKLTRPGSLIVVDNVVRNGAVADPDNRDPGVEGVRRLVDLIAAEPRVSATALQTVGAKGYDGLLVARVNSA